MRIELFTVYLYDPSENNSGSDLGVEVSINSESVMGLDEEVVANLVKVAAQSILDGYDKAVHNGAPVQLD